MTFPTAALTGGNLTSIRSQKWKGASYACLVPNTVVWSSSLSATATGTTNATVSYGATISGNAANVQVGHRVLIGTANDVRKATFSGRVRTAPAAGSMGINETSAALTSGMFLWVVDDYPLLDKLARPVGSPPIQYKDYNLTYQGLLPVIVGVQLGYAGFINSSNKLRIAFDVSTSYAAESGATISSYLFTFTAATYTVISGSLSTATVTVDFNEGFQWGKLVVTDSGGRTQTRHFMIFACGNSTTPALSFQGANINATLSEGWTATTSAFADVSSVLDNTPIIIFTQEWYNDVEGPINNNIDMIGWLRDENDPAQTDGTQSLIPSSQFEITGVGTKLARLEAQLLALSNVASPANWDEINNLTPWRGIVHFLQRHSTLLELVDLTFDSTDNTFLFPYLTTQGGNILGAVNGIADQINAAMEFAPDGAIRVVRDARYLSSAARNALITYANWSSANADYSDPQGQSLQYTHEQSLGKVDADGAFYNSTDGSVTAFRSRAPGLAQDAGQDVVNLNNQILAAGADINTAQTELNQRAGNLYEIARTPSYKLSTSHPDPYHFLIPSKQIWYTWTLTAGTDNIRGISYDTSTRWLLLDINITIDNGNGTRTVQVTYQQESAIGNPATTIIIPAPGSLDLTIPAFPPFDPFPNFPDLGILEGISASNMPPFVDTGITGIPGHHIVAPSDGNSVIIWTATLAWTSRSFKARSTPVWTAATPSDLGSFQIYDIQFDPTSGTRSIGCYLLASDGTNSAVWHTTDVFNAPVTWMKGVSFVGVYQTIRVSNTSGSVLVYSVNSSGTTEIVYDFTVSDQGFTVPSGLGTYVAATGWQSTYATDATDGYQGVYLNKLLTGTIVSMQAFFNRTAGTFNEGGFPVKDGLFPDSGTFPNAFYQANSVNGPFGSNLTISGTGNFATTVIAVQIMAGHNNPSTADPGGTALLTKLIVDTSGGSSSANVRSSSDSGNTFGAPITIGTNPGTVGGFDINKIGNTSIAAQDQKTRSATTLGGTYSDTTGGGTTGAEPLTILIPRYKFGGTTTNANLASPDFLLGASALVSSEALWKVSGGTQTAITPSSAGTKALAFSADGAAMGFKNGSIIAYLGKVSGTAHAFTSSNAGGAWTDLGAMSGALSIRIRKSDLLASPAVFIAGGTVLKYGSNLTATPSNRTKPISSGLLGIEVYG